MKLYSLEKEVNYLTNKAKVNVVIELGEEDFAVFDYAGFDMIDDENIPDLLIAIGKIYKGKISKGHISMEKVLSILPDEFI